MDGLDHLDELDRTKAMLARTNGELAHIRDKLAESRRTASSLGSEVKELRETVDRCVKQIGKYRAAARIFRGFLNDQLEDID
jgi:predicted RNA-binding Zn ribbon-like protein